MFTPRRRPANSFAATFEHDTARPVDGYAAPQLHTHAVIFNVTERDNGQTRALQPQELFASQRYATSVYRSELSMRLQGLGYELERGKHGQPEIKGYTKEYLEASSPRREQIKDHLREMGIDGAGAAQVAAHRTRDSKELLSPGEVLERHRNLAAQYGHQADRVVAEARERGQRHVHEPALNRSTVAAQQAVTYARDHLFERSAVLDRRELLEAALNRGMGETTYGPCPAGVRAAGRARRVPHSQSWRRGTAVHHRRNASHGTRDRRTDAGRQSARDERPDAGGCAYPYCDGRPPPGAEYLAASGGQ